MRSLQDRVAFIINIYQHNKCIPLKNAKYIRVVEILLALIWVDGRGTIPSKSRTFVVLQLATNVALIFSLYTNCPNRSCGKKFNITAFVNLHIYNVYVNFIPWRNLHIVSTKLFRQSDLLRINEYKIQILYYKKNPPLLNWCAWTATASECSALSASRDVSATKSIKNQVFATVAI